MMLFDERRSNTSRSARAVPPLNSSNLLRDLRGPAKARSYDKKMVGPEPAVRSWEDIGAIVPKPVQSTLQVGRLQSLVRAD